MPSLDFAAVRAAVTMQGVLQLLGFQSRTTYGSQQRGACPLHGASRGTARCFSVNLQQQVFHCFKCGRSGNQLDLWAHATRQTPYDAALDLCRRFSLPVPALSQNREEEPVMPENIAASRLLQRCVAASPQRPLPVELPT